MKISELQHQRAGLATEAHALLEAADVEKRGLSEDETKRCDALEKEIETINSRIEREQRLFELEAQRAMPDNSDATQPSREERMTMPNDTGFRSFGEFLQAVARAANPQERVDPRLLNYRDNEARAGTGMSEGIPSDGGFMVQTDYVNQLLQKTYESSNIAARCRRIPVSANANGIKMNYINETSRVDGSRFGGVLAYWRGESITKTQSQPALGQLELNLKKLTGLYWATDELLQDASALESLVTGIFAQEFSFKLDHEILWGNGATQPLGIMSSAALITQAAEAGQPIDTVLFENIVGMYSRLYGPSRKNAIWLINQDIEPQLFGMGLTIGMAGSPVYLPAGGIAGAPFGTIFGRPVIPCESCSTLGGVGDIILADFSEYILIEKGGIQGASSIHVHFTQDETCFRFVYRVDGAPAWPGVLTPHTGSANTLSPYVSLAAR
jgi:HK97 family phage major capsid protein